MSKPTPKKTSTSYTEATVAILAILAMIFVGMPLIIFLTILIFS